jgi:hypothetical protein
MEKVLIVDDNRASRDLIRAILKSVHCEIIEASHGQQGLELLRQEQPDLVLLDIDMPGLDGFEVVKKIREDGFCGLACRRCHGLRHGPRPRESYGGGFHGVHNKACSRGRFTATGPATARNRNWKIEHGTPSNDSCRD